MREVGPAVVADDGAEEVGPQRDVAGAGEGEEGRHVGEEVDPGETVEDGGDGGVGLLGGARGEKEGEGGGGVASGFEAGEEGDGYAGERKARGFGLVLGAAPAYEAGLDPAIHGHFCIITSFHAVMVITRLYFLGFLIFFKGYL